MNEAKLPTVREPLLAWLRATAITAPTEIEMQTWVRRQRGVGRGRAHGEAAQLAADEGEAAALDLIAVEQR